MSDPASVSVDTSTVGEGSIAAFQRAAQVLPGGVSRATIERDPSPRFMDHGTGAYLFDVDGRRFLDLNNNFTALLHGHAFPPVVRAVCDQLRNGSCFANPTLLEARLAELLCSRIPAVEMVRFVNTGTEAVMFAIKAARAFTGRTGVAKFEGTYHGGYDWAEVSQGGSPSNWGSPESPCSVAAYRGMPESVLSETLVMRFNQPDEVRRLISEHGQRLAAVIIDPMPSRAGLIAPDPDFVEALHDACRKNGVLLICDEVLNLRQGFNGAAARFGLEPDLLVMGKIIGGGLPIGAIGGRRGVMEVFSDKNGVATLPQSGTFSANPLSLAAGLAAMEAATKDVFDGLEALGARLRSDLQSSLTRNSVPFCVTGSASLFRIHPRIDPPREYRHAYLNEKDLATMRRLSRHLSQQGILMPPAAAACLSTPMQAEECDAFATAVDEFFQKLS